MNIYILLFIPLLTISATLQAAEVPDLSHITINKNDKMFGVYSEIFQSLGHGFEGFSGSRLTELEIKHRLGKIQEKWQQVYKLEKDLFGQKYADAKLRERIEEERSVLLCTREVTPPEPVSYMYYLVASDLSEQESSTSMTLEYHADKVGNHDDIYSVLRTRFDSWFTRGHGWLVKSSQKVKTNKYMYIRNTEEGAVGVVVDLEYLTNKVRVRISSSKYNVSFPGYVFDELDREYK